MRNPAVRGAFVVVLTLFTLAAAVPGRAQDALTPLDTELSDAELDRRIRFIEQRLDASRTHGRIWYWSWMTVNAGSAVVQGAIAASIDNHDDRVNLATNAALGAVGVADLMLRPLQARHGADPIRELPETSRDERIAKLRAAEDRLRRNADRAAERTSWEVHAGNAALAAAAGTLVGLWGNPSDGVITGAAALAGGEINIWTQPAAPRRDWQDYRAMVGGRADLATVAVYIDRFEDGVKGGLRLGW